MRTGPPKKKSLPGSSFDRLQYKNGGEGLGERVTCVTSGRREGGRCLIVVIHKLCVDQPRVYHTTSCIDAVFQMLQSQVLGQDITRRTSRFFVGHRPPSRLPSRLPDVTHVTLSPRPSPPFLYCKRSKLEPGTAWERG